jgi:hypothetical protein
VTATLTATIADDERVGVTERSTQRREDGQQPAAIIF